MQVVLEYIGGKLMTYICFTALLVFRTTGSFHSYHRLYVLLLNADVTFCPRRVTELSIIRLSPEMADSGGSRYDELARLALPISLTLPSSRLQTARYEVFQVSTPHPVHRLGTESQEQRLPPRLLLL